MHNATFYLVDFHMWIIFKKIGGNYHDTLTYPIIANVFSKKKTIL